MGRLKTSVPEGYFGFRSKPNQKGERRLYLIYYLPGHEGIVTTGISIRPDDWDIDWKNHEIKKNLYKGKVPHTAPLMDEAWGILKRWKAKECNAKFVFDLLPASFDLEDIEELEKQRKSKNKVIQVSLRSIGRKMKSDFPFNLSIHVARHSFAVYALNKGTTVHMISRLLGHSSITTTEKVYAKFLPETLKEEVMKNLNGDAPKYNQG